MSIFNIFNKTKEAFDKAAQAKQELQRAERLAQTKHFREAVQIGEKILADWSSDPSLGEQLARQMALGDVLEQVKQQLAKWRKPINDAERLAADAQYLLNTDKGNPLDTQAQSQAIALFKQCIGLIYDPNYTHAIVQCEREIIQRQKFQSLVAIGDSQAKNLFFKEALSTYNEAKKLYLTPIIESTIANCYSQIQQEEAYEAVLIQVNQIVSEGKLKAAIALLNSTLANFPRSDGIELREQLQRSIKGKEYFRVGLNLEKAGNLATAVNNYKQALTLLPDTTECQVRLAIVEVKNQNWSAAISWLQNINNSQANYLRGFAYAQQRNLQQASIEWQSITHPDVVIQGEIIKLIGQRDRLLALKEIEQFVDANKLNEAKAASLAFIEKFSSEPLVQSNLDEHIQARLDHTVWQSKNWSTIAETAAQVWVENQDITSLHNWAVAAYYHAQLDPSKLIDSIVALSTAIANINLDLSLKNIPWLTENSVDLNEVSRDLKQLLEDIIDSLKDRDREEYFRLRDRYRLEVTALRLMGNPPNCGMRVKDVFITPGCYQRFRHQLQAITFPPKLWATLYTEWGLAVAACMEGDTARAIQIKPILNPSSDVEKFAISFISYHEGCYFLQNKNWQEAVNPLHISQAEIKASDEWVAEIDRLCGIQRKAIYNLNEHLEFAQFWYNLLGSKAASSYLAEYQSEAIKEKLLNSEISYQQALAQLEKIKQIDEYNPVVLDLISEIELSYEVDEIEKLLKKLQFEEMIKYAKRSRHDKVRFIVAEIFINILISGIENGELTNQDEIRQLGKWAYEICPYEPAFQQVYNSLGLN